METLKRGRQSFVFNNQPKITYWASVAGKKEAEGPLSDHYDVLGTDSYWGQKSWEQAENHMQQLALQTLCKKAGLDTKSLELIISGDLLNQCIGSSFPIRNSGIPHLGLYGACSTMAEGLVAASMAVGGGFWHSAVALTSSHFASSERQYRFPLGYGGQRNTTAQWTVTGAGAAMIAMQGDGPQISACTVGTITDLGIKDATNMGAAMAPAACATIKAHFQDLQISESDYDLIITGDLGHLGRDILHELLLQDGIYLADKLVDCGTLVFDADSQDVHSGGSGCGCSAITLCGYLLDKLKEGKYKNILFCGTGALLSPTSTQQGLPIPGVCHAVSIRGGI